MEKALAMNGHDLHPVGVEPAGCVQRQLQAVHGEPGQLVDPPDQRQRERLERHDQRGDDDGRATTRLAPPRQPGQGERGHAVDERCRAATVTSEMTAS